MNKLLCIFLTFLLATMAVASLTADTRRPGYIRGKVVDEDGMSLQWVNVSCWSGETRVKGAQTDARGEFGIPLPPGNYRLQYNHIGYRSLDSLNVDIAEGDTLHLAPLRMSRAGLWDEAVVIGPAGRLILKVTDSEGAPLDSVRVTCRDANGAEKYGFTNLEGMLRFRPLTAGEYTLRCERNGYLTIPQKVVSVQPDLATHLRVKMIRDAGLGWIRGTVSDSAGTGLQWVNVICLQGYKRITGVQTNAQGNFIMRAPEGSFTLRFKLIGYETVDSLSVEVTAGDTTIVAPITLMPGTVKFIDILPTNGPE